MDVLQKEKLFSEIKHRYELIKPTFSEKERRLWAANESMSIGHSGDVIVQKATGLSRVTIRKGRKEIKNKIPETTDKIRKSGGGRKTSLEKNPKIARMLDRLIHPFSRSEGKHPTLRWTLKSPGELAKELSTLLLSEANKERNVKLKKGEITVSQRVVCSIMKSLGYDLSVKKKNAVDKKYDDYMNMQFHVIYEAVKKHLKMDLPIISIDVMKNDNLNQINDVSHVFKNKGWENVGVDNDTARFAIEAIREWWEEKGRVLFTNLPGLLITTGGVKNEFWLQELQKISNELGSVIQICHFPPSIRKWNKIEHQTLSSLIMKMDQNGSQVFCTIVNLVATIAEKNKSEPKAQLNYDDAKELKNEKNLGKWNDLLIPGGFGI